MTITIKDPSAPVTEAQFSYLVKLICQVHAAAPGVRADELLKAAGYTKGEASAKIELLKAAGKGMPAPAAAMPAYVAPFGHYMVDGKHVQVKKAKYSEKIYVMVNDIYIGTLGHSNAAAEAIAKLDSAEAAYASVIEFAKVTGKCGVCHTKLTDPKSIAKGIGPVCAKKYGY